jgi:Ca2+-binding RTX toxin-like protein
VRPSRSIGTIADLVDPGVTASARHRQRAAGRPGPEAVRGGVDMANTPLRVLTIAIAGMAWMSVGAFAPAHAAGPPQAVAQTRPGNGPNRSACTITGTDGNDELVGTPGDDVICGYGGDDIILGLAGDDLLIGGPGDDILVGGTGRDVLIGDEGNDRLIDTREPGVEDGGPDADRCVGVHGTLFNDCERVYTI